MYLLDTNIFLEILLPNGRKSKAAKHLFIANPCTDLFVTDFSLHSIGVFLFQRNRHETYVSFVKDVMMDGNYDRVDPEDVLALAEVSKTCLDFDDAYQYAVATKVRPADNELRCRFATSKKEHKIPELK